MLKKVTATGPQVTGNKTEKGFKQQRPIKTSQLYRPRPQPHGRDQKSVDLVRLLIETLEVSVN